MRDEADDLEEDFVCLPLNLIALFQGRALGLGLAAHFGFVPWVALQSSHGGYLRGQGVLLP